MWCYEESGHNEGDDPSFTQPLMYRKIKDLRTIRKRYVGTPGQPGDLTVEAEEALAHFRKQLDRAFEEIPPEEKETPPKVERNPSHSNPAVVPAVAGGSSTTWWTTTRRWRRMLVGPRREHGWKNSIGKFCPCFAAGKENSRENSRTSQPLLPSAFRTYTPPGSARDWLRSIEPLDALPPHFVDSTHPITGAVACHPRVCLQYGCRYYACEIGLS
jgi:hypothetical protein